MNTATAAQGTGDLQLRWVHRRSNCPELGGPLFGAGRPWMCEDYDLMKARMSALIVSACVVSMPCG